MTDLMTLWVVDEIGGTWIFFDEHDARQWATAEEKRGAEDLTLGTLPIDDPDVIAAMVEVAIRKGGTLVQRFTETPAEYL